MKFGKIFKVFKKGAKVAAKRKGKKGGEPIHWPGGTRIGIFGHTNAGKTVYFTVLNEECKISKKLQISVTDSATAGEFLAHYRSIWGLGTATDAGTVVDFQGEKKFPDQTRGDKILRFNAIVDRKKKLSIVAYDYDGKTVSLSPDDPELADKVADFMTGCDGLLFFYDPKLLAAELESQARVASFVNMLEQLAPLRSRLPIPMAVVITKADILPGFSGDDKVALIGPEDEYLTSEDFGIFLEKVLAGDKVVSDLNWSGSVRNVLVKLKDFLRVVLQRTLDFQLFFVSCTGQEPEKVGTDVGRSIYVPPPRMQPIGVKEPFYWLLKSIIRNKRISRFRALAKYVVVASIIWMVLVSLPYLIHFKYLYPKPAKVEQRISEIHGGSLISASKEERSQIGKAYNKYERSSVVRWFFGDFRGPAKQIAKSYQADQLRMALKDLNEHIGRFASIAASPALWPQVKPSDSTIIPNEEHDKLLAVLDKYHQSDSTSELFIKSGRALDYWGLFVDGVKKPKDEAVWETIQNQIKQDSSLYWGDLSKEERQLGQALLAIKVEKEQKKVIETATLQLDDLVAGINGNPSPEYRLKQAVDTLTKIKGSVDSKSASRINTYVRKAKQWQKSRQYVYAIESIPADWHLHIAVAEKGQDPEWKKGEQIFLFPGREDTITWKSGDVIYISIDSIHSGDESWGEKPRAKEILRGDFSVFRMEGDVTFDDIGKKISIRFVPGLESRLPEL
jgi:hypothetical protein